MHFCEISRCGRDANVSWLEYHLPLVWRVRVGLAKTRGEVRVVVFAFQAAERRERPERTDDDDDGAGNP